MIFINNEFNTIVTSSQNSSLIEIMNINENTRLKSTITFQSSTFSENTKMVSICEDFGTDNSAILSIQNHLQVTSSDVNNNNGYFILHKYPTNQ